MTRKLLRCYQCDKDKCNASIRDLPFCENATHCWESTLRLDDGSERNAHGCIRKLQHARLMCSNRMQMSDSRYRIKCCMENFCNNGTFSYTDSPENYISTMELTLTIIITMLALGLIIIKAVYCYCCYQKVCLPREIRAKKSDKYEQNQHQLTMNLTGLSSTFISDGVSSEFKIGAVRDSTVKKYLGADSASGSGSGMPLLNQRTLSNEITLIERLSEGRFVYQPELWRGIWLGGSSITVKIYPSRSESAWNHETRIYTEILHGHENVVEFIGSDVTSAACCTQMWLVTSHLPNGLLRNYLRHTTLNRNKMLRMATGLASGLLYLHSEMHGRKLSVAHRNLSSTNVFVNESEECVIGNFELAITQEGLGGIDFLDYTSARYMSPELLKQMSEHTIWSLEDFRRADIYSLSLVLWEICCRCIYGEDNVTFEYVVPFSDFLIDSKCEPTVREMRTLIVTNSLRPKIPDQWHSDQIMKGMRNLILECWQTTAAGRCTILQVLKILKELAKNDYI